MQLRYEQLAQHLQKNLLPLYFISGDVPLLLQESSELIRNTAKQQGYTERQVFQVDSGFSWPKFLADTNNYSLFATKQLIELRFMSNQVGDAGSKALQAYAMHPPADKILIITMPKLETQQQKSNWVKALTQAGGYIQIWPIAPEQLPQWIEKRLAQSGLQADKAGIELLAAYAEGNLLAAAQEIEKLRLLTTENLLTFETISQAITDQARFDIFQLAATALQGNQKRTLRILAELKDTGTESTLILWALAREIRVLTQITYTVQSGIALEQAMQKFAIWEKQKPLVRQALQRHTLQTLIALLQKAKQCDQIIKGLMPGNIWDELEQLALRIAGVNILCS